MGSFWELQLGDHKMSHRGSKGTYVRIFFKPNGNSRNYMSIFARKRGSEAAIEHWYVPLDNFQFSPQEFYQRIEQELNARKIPGLKLSRLKLEESGILSDQREYLRVERERITCDICAAPFGTSFFFSFRFVELPPGITAAQMFGAFFIFCVFFGILGQFVGYVIAFLGFLVVLCGSVYAARDGIAAGFKDPAPSSGNASDAETYYQKDARLMFATTVRTVTEAVVEEVTASKGIKLLKRFQRKPEAGELYEESERPVASSAK
jgi:hypothetical protein